MADRDFTINVDLTARNDTDRAVAAASANIEAYDKLLDEQAAKTDAQVRANKRLSDSHAAVAVSQQKAFQGNSKLIQAQSDYSKAVEGAARADANYRKGDVQSLANQVTAREKVVAAQKAISDEIKRSSDAGEIADKAGATRASRLIQQQSERNALEKEYSRLQDELTQKTKALSQATDSRQISQLRNDVDDLGQSFRNLGARGLDVSEVIQKAFDVTHVNAFQAAQARVNATMSDYQKLVDNVAKSEKARDDTLVRIGQKSPTGSPSDSQKPLVERLDISVDQARAKLDAFRAEERSRGVKVPIELDESEITKARQAIDELANLRARGAGGPGGTPAPKTGPGTQDPYGLQNLEKQFNGLGNSVDGFNRHITNTLGVLITASIQPFAAALLGIVGAFMSVASAGIAAGTAMGTVFLSSTAQAIPVLGLFAAAADRVKNVLALVTGEMALQQQAFVAQYTAAYQSSLGINQVVDAEHAYSDALYAQGQSVIGVSTAELTLATTRQQAIRQIQQLVDAEVSARLAAEASSLSVVDAQKALQQAIQSGGDVQQAQLSLAQAQAGHVQAVQTARNAITDAGKGSLARQGITEQVANAERAVTQAKRAVVDAQFAAVQAKAAVTQAQQAQQGFNIATAAQLAYLRSQMTTTELSLASNIGKIFDLFRGAHGLLTPMTNAILAPFVEITDEIYKLLHDPRILSALQGLADGIGKAIGDVSKVFLSPSGINTFIALIHAAAQNMVPLGNIISNIFKALGPILTTAIPYVHQFATFIASLTKQFSDWANSNQGKNWLRDWFKEAFAALEQFINLGVAAAKLVAAIVGVAGGAKSGISLFADLTDKINKATASINAHGSAYKTLQNIFGATRVILSALWTIIKAVAGAIYDLGDSKRGQDEFKNLAGILSNILIPAFVNFAKIIGAAINSLTQFLNKNPEVAKMIKDLITASLVAGVGFKALSVFIGPVLTLIGAVGGLVKVFTALRDAINFIKGAAIFGEGGSLEGFAAMAGPIGIAVAAIVALSVATHNLGKLVTEVLSPFKLAFEDIKDAAQPLITAIDQLGNAFGIKVGGAHKIVSDLLTALGILLRFIVTLMVQPIVRAFELIGSAISSVAKIVKDSVQIWKGVFDVIKGLVTLNGQEIIKGFKEIGKGMLDGLIDVLLAIPRAILAIFKGMLTTVMNFLGIHSPSTVFKTIGQGIVDGLMSAVEAIPSLFLKIGEDLVKSMIKGIGNLAGDAAKAITSLIPSPIKNIASGAGKVLGTSGGGGILHGFGLWAEGGPVGGGYGGGDRHPALLESGEHVLTKEEVRSAGGHGAIFAMRAALGGGKQGGPFGYATGGAVINTPTASASGSGSQIAQLQAFTQQYLVDWGTFLNTLYSDTETGVDNENTLFENSFKTILTQLTTFIQTFDSDFTAFWNKTQASTQTQLGDFSTNFKNTYTKVAQDTQKIFEYISDSANKDLKEFGSKPDKVSIGAIPHFASGGFIGMAGERGRDVVHAVLGRGEAVLNYAHQRMVEPAMNAMYGFGLGGMFNRVNASHAGESTGYATGGFVADAGTNYSVGQEPKIVAALTKLGKYIHEVIYGISGYRSPEQSVEAGGFADDPHTKGEASDIGVGSPTRASAAQLSNALLAKFGLWRPFDLYGNDPAELNHVQLLPSLGGPQEGVAAPDKAGASASSIIQGVSSGLSLMSTAASAIQKVSVHGSGVLAETLKGAIGKVTKAANTMIGADNTSGAATGAGNMSASGVAPGSWMTIVKQLAKKVGWGSADISAWQGVEGIEDGGYSLTATDPDGGAYGLAQMLAPGGVGPSKQKYYSYGGNPNTLIGQLTAMWNYIRETYGNPIKALAHEHAKGWYAKGGFAGGAVPIIAHAGEWVLNKGQQSRLGQMIGASVDGVKNALGLSSQPKAAYADGGVVSEYGNIGSNGSLTGPSYGFDSLSYAFGEANQFNKAINIVTTQIQKHIVSLNTGLNTFLTDYNTVGDVFATAQNDLNDAYTEFQNRVTMLSEGVKVVAGKLVVGAPQTAVGVDTSQLNMDNAQIGSQSTLRNDQQSNLDQIDKRIKSMGKPDASDLKQYQQLIADRQNLITDIDNSDSALAQDYQNKYQEVVQKFQDQVAQVLRGTATLSGGSFSAIFSDTSGGGISTSIKALQNAMAKVGPNTALALAQTAQTVAQTFGNQGQMESTDSAVLTAAKASQAALQKEYAAAAAKAKNNPQFQSVADDLFSQLQSAVTTVAQAQAQSLSDAISGEDNTSSAQSSYTSMLQRIATVVQNAGNGTTGIQQQIGVSQQTATDTQSQIDAYTSLLGQAQAQGNQSDVLELQSKIEDLTATLAETNLATQQLKTAYQQQLVTNYSTSTGAQQGANSFATTILQAVGSLLGPTGTLAQQIGVSQNQGAALASQGQGALGLISSAESNGSFGDNQSGANSILSGIANAFGNGPAAFAQYMQSNSSSIGNFEAGLPQDQLTLFQNLVGALTDNSTAVENNTVETQQLITSYSEAIVSQNSAVSSATSGFIQSAQGIFTTLGTITGSLDLPQQIAALTAYGADLVSEGQSAVGAIQTAMSNGSFGSSQGAANGLLSGATSAFGQGPAAFATWLSQNAGSLSSFESSLPSDQSTLFQGLIQALTDNVSATTSNTLAIQNLESTENQQSFTSAAWTNFREAIFNGTGGLLPQYAMSVPSMDVGGTLMSDGLLYGHQGETITPAAVVKGNAGAGKTINQENHFHYTQPMEVADPVLHGNQVAWRLNHDPNSR